MHRRPWCFARIGAGTDTGMTDTARPVRDTTTREFRFRFTTPYRIAGLPFGVLPGTCAVVLSEGKVVARLGPWKVSTGLDNVASAQLSGPLEAVKTAGPARLSFADRGLTFATNPDQAVCMRFHRAVCGIEPTGLLRHPGLTVTVADCTGLLEALEAATP